jgi:HK97 family phage portal protein
MLNAIKALLAPQSIRTTETDVNLLDRIIYGYTTNNSLITWYDSNNRTYIEQGYQGNAMVYSIIKKIADKSATVPIVTYREDGKVMKSYKSFKYNSNANIKSQERIFKKQLNELNPLDDFHKLIKNPNPRQSSKEFISDISTWYNTLGEAFIYGFRPETGKNAGKLVELWVMPSNYVEIVSGGAFMPVKGYKLAIGNQSITIPASDVLHIKNTNLTWDTAGSQLRGQSPLLAGKNILQKNNESVAAGLKAMQNEGAKGIVSPNFPNADQWPTPEARAQIDQRIQERVDGSANRNRIVASSIPLRYDAIGLSPVSLDIINSMNYDDEKLCGLWGVNPVIFKPNATNANLEGAQKSLVTDVVLPQLQLFEEKINEFLQMNGWEGRVLDFDTTQFAELQPDMELLFKTYGENKAYTPNELRLMTGFDPSEDPAMDMHWISSSLISSTEAMSMGGGDFSDFGNA